MFNFSVLTIPPPPRSSRHQVPFTNKYVKQMILGPKDEVQSLAKQENMKKLKEISIWMSSSEDR